MRLAIVAFSLVALTACQTTIPTDGSVPVTTTDTKPLATDATGTSADATAENPATTDPAKPDVVLSANHPTISNTQDFGETTANLSIADDKAILAAQRDEFKVIAPKALPKRVKTISVVEYALSSQNAVGEKKYTRLNPLAASLSKRNCARYGVPDEAQMAFLKSGGPRRDPGSLDPDGDGFACDWSPEIYRKLVRK